VCNHNFVPNSSSKQKWLEIYCDLSVILFNGFSTCLSLFTLLVIKFDAIGIDITFLQWQSTALTNFCLNLIFQATKQYNQKFKRIAFKAWSELVVFINSNKDEYYLLFIIYWIYRPRSVHCGPFDNAHTKLILTIVELSWTHCIIVSLKE
jgi:hypothetical protein